MFCCRLEFTVVIYLRIGHVLRLHNRDSVKRILVLRVDLFRRRHQRVGLIRDNTFVVSLSILIVNPVLSNR